MKLNLPIFDEPIALSGLTILTVESTAVFARLVQLFYQYNETSELRLFDQKSRSLKEAEVMLVTDILGFDVNAPSVLKLIHADLEQQLNNKPEVKSMIDKLSSTITELIAYECLENELDLEYDEVTILELIKALGVRVETANDTIFEKCFEILQIVKYLAKKRLLVLVNSGAYFSCKELARLKEYIDLNQMTVLFLEPRRLYDLPQYVLDDDYFLITENML
ncbi:type II-A CRISPR-associated protein Csn2 [Streptococcus ovuberis]|uniref:Type II-A CRISPR-associated protein Csn2 n=2 Tax=Streptococcus ovuberis TaxID=1936207 RepID=A0A7X6RZP7_9STRE|nr:type II-A CRISPR-associated protein Csn2 [Streptococcus ovuberis]